MAMKDSFLPRLPPYVTRYPVPAEASVTMTCGASTRLFDNGSLVTQVPLSIQSFGRVNQFQFQAATLPGSTIFRLASDMPIVGNVEAEGELFGLQKNYPPYFKGRGRGLSIINDTGNLVVIIEPDNYFGRPAGCVRSSRVCLVKLPITGGAFINQDLIDKLLAQRAILDAKGVQLVVVQPAAFSPIYSPFSYGCPHAGFVDPGPKTPFTNFEGGEMLTIFFSGNEFGPLQNDIFGLTFESAVGSAVSDSPIPHFITRVKSPYFIESFGQTWRVYATYSIVPPPTTFIIAPYNFAVPGSSGSADAAYWKSLDDRFKRRSWVLHNTFFTNFSPIQYLQSCNMTNQSFPYSAPLAISFTFAASPVGGQMGGLAYFNTVVQPGMVYGRDVNHDESAFVAITSPNDNYRTDIVNAIYEDIATFF